MNKKIELNGILVNEEINNSKIRIVGNMFPTKDVITREKAIEIAYNNNMDLILMSTANDGVGICKIMELSKFIYDKKQKNKLQKINNKKVKTKELRFTYNTGEHDFEFKLNHAMNFLKEGHKVKAYVMFSGRESNYSEMGNLLLLNFINSLKDFGKAESLPQMDGKRLWVIIAPKK